uniref:Uncharacterized protein n=1 Tax=Rhizophora mucronata TaxID=61149 RepID=A0A2P2QY60_RHIMU
MEILLLHEYCIHATA